MKSQQVTYIFLAPHLPGPLSSWPPISLTPRLPDPPSYFSSLTPPRPQCAIRRSRGSWTCLHVRVLLPPIPA